MLSDSEHERHQNLPAFVAENAQHADVLGARAMAANMVFMTPKTPPIAMIAAIIRMA